MLRINVISGIPKVLKLLNSKGVQSRSESFRWLSAGNGHFQKKVNDEAGNSERTLPSLIFIQNPITWLVNKIDFKMLKAAWDPDFDEKEFKRGTKQAISVICTLISQNKWEDMRGLVTRQALTRLQRDVEVRWTDEQRRNIHIKPTDIKLALTRKIHFLRIGDQKFADVDMLFFALKFKEDILGSTDIVVIKMVARFHRNYTLGQPPNWTVSLFKVTGFNVHATKN